MSEIDTTDRKIFDLLMEDGRMPSAEIARRIGGVSERSVRYRIWVFKYAFTPPYKGSTRIYEFDNQPVKEALQDAPLTHPDVITFIRSSLEEGIAQTRK